MTRTSATPTESERGITLIELLVVLGVLSLLAFLLAGRLTVPDRYGTGKDVATIMGVLRDARLQALSTGRPFAVAVKDLPQGYAVAPAIGKAAEAILFYPDGSSSGGVVRKDEKDIVLIDWFSGLARHAG